ncbi:DUF995 domain-containing protein [Leisingera daeponensis]|uniref:DUF995 domain-containing protein n=1 Tax=Leisingera daeponensis TaxID=405746 RepID=UPI001C9855B4|nr:DUF995 domain-containing protein [Leisingera daeponensis]MBY6057831.1 DUF995 domain-containing protein [Leisingera daeponensis]
MSLFKTFAAVACASVIAATSAAFAGPDKKNRVSGQSIAKLYSGKTWIWSKGGSYWAPDGSFQAIWGDSVGLGKWYATSKGNLCYEAVWYDGKGAAGSQHNECFRHVADSQGQLWKYSDKDKSWYKPTREFAERVKPGNEISSQVRKLRRKYGV